MTYIIDIDGVIGTKTDWTTEDISSRLPETFLNIGVNQKVIDKINELYATDNTIILHTARLWHDYKVTVEWLHKWQVHYHSLVMAKPLGDFYVDDKNLSVADFIK